MRQVSMIGRTYDYLTVISEVEPYVYPSGRKRKQYECLCKCGTTVNVIQNCLVSGNNKSCGCRKSEAEHNPKYSHGLAGTIVHQLWTSIKNRCNNPKSEYYHIYGARGIKMCNEWASDFKVFHIWAVANGYKKGLQIDRIDNDKGYSPDNCRFVTIKEQMNNRRSNIRIGICGEFKTLTQWCEAVGVPWDSAYHRFRRTGDIHYSLGIA